MSDYIPAEERERMLDQLDRRTATCCPILENNLRWVVASHAEADRRIADLEADHERECLDLIDERDALHERLDQLALAVGGIEVIGEHSNLNDPWAEALELVTPYLEVEALRGLVDDLATALRSVTKWVEGPCGCGMCMGHQIVYTDTERLLARVDALDAPNKDAVRTASPESEAPPTPDHELKIWPTHFAAVADGTKRAEIRILDRDFRVGNILALREFDPEQCPVGNEGIIGYTGERLLVEVTHMLTAVSTQGIVGGFAVLSIKPVEGGEA